MISDSESGWFVRSHDGADPADPILVSIDIFGRQVAMRMWPDMLELA